MRNFNALSVVLGAVFLLSACHVPYHHHPPGHGGIPPGQAKKGGWHTPPGHRHRHHDLRNDTDSAPIFY